MKIAIAAGGTGGHVFPADAVLEACVEQAAELILITDARGGALFQNAHNIPRLTLDIYHSDRPWAFLLKWLSLLRAGMETMRFLKREKPEKLLSFGGYPTLPAVLAAQLCGIPIILHEQNAILGRVNRFCARFAQKIALSFQKTARIPTSAQGKTIWTGLPLRQQLMEVPETPYHLPEPGQKWRLLIIGGSQGAAVFSDVMPKAIRRLSLDLQAQLHIVQQVRPGLEDITRAAYQDLPCQVTLQTFFPHIATQLAAAHLIIARAGAGSVFEAAFARRPIIFVPLPTAMDQHQLKNAEAVSEAGGAWVMPQNTFTPEALAQKLTVLFDQNCDTLTRQAAAWDAFPKSDATARLTHLLIK